MEHPLAHHGRTPPRIVRPPATRAARWRRATAGRSPVRDAMVGDEIPQVSLPAGDRDGRPELANPRGARCNPSPRRGLTGVSGGVDSVSLRKAPRHFFGTLLLQPGDDAGLCFCRDRQARDCRQCWKWIGPMTECDWHEKILEDRATSGLFEAACRPSAARHRGGCAKAWRTRRAGRSRARQLDRRAPGSHPIATIACRRCR
jgi:hypothetical protein